jgi:hypothetical protein
MEAKIDFDHIDYITAGTNHRYNMGAAIDIVGHIVALVPLEDHATVSSLSCVCREWSGLFAEFLAVNAVVDVRRVAADTEICWCDRMHGTITRTMYYIEWAIVRYGLRAYAPRTSHPAVGYDTYMMVFSFGALQSIRNSGISYIRATIAEIPVAVMIVCSRDGSNRTIMLRLWSDRSCLTIQIWHYHDPIWSTQVQIVASEFESDADDVNTILAQDLGAFIAPYKKLARQMLWLPLG